MSEDDPGGADIEGVVDLRRGVAIIERGQHQPGLEAGEVVDEQRGTVRHERRHAVARLQAERQIVGREPAGRLVEVRPRPHALHGDQRRLVGAIVHPDLQQFGELDGGFQQGSRLRHR